MSSSAVDSRASSLHGLANSDGVKLEGVHALTLEHYAPKLVSRVRSVEQERHPTGAFRSRFDKPRGLWVSIKGEDDWPSWCDSEGYALDRLTHIHAVELAPHANILLINGEREIHRFTDDYGFDSPWGEGRYTDRVIDWERVAKAYDGIIIAPYVWACRMERYTGWYYGWDCASGCIWNARAISRLSPMTSGEAVAARQLRDTQK